MSDKLTEWAVECAKSPGSRWRLAAYSTNETFEVENKGTFDELVVDHWLHIEQMDERLWILRVGDKGFFVKVLEDGSVQLSPTGDESRAEG